VPFVATLRQAYEVMDILRKSDNSLRPADYHRKKLFLKFTTLQELKEAMDVYEDYCLETSKSFAGRLDYTNFLALPRLKVPWADPTLFRENEVKLLSDAEQQLLTQLLCSGDSDSLVQGAVSLQSMLTGKQEDQVRVSPVPELVSENTDDLHIEPHDFIAQLFCGAHSVMESTYCATSSSADEDEMNSSFDDNSMLAHHPAVPITNTMGGTTQGTWEDSPASKFDPHHMTSLTNEQLMERMFGLTPGASIHLDSPQGLSRAACSFRSFRQRTSSRIQNRLTSSVTLTESVSTPEVVNLPLPNRMPRVFDIPTYNPTGWYKPIKFNKFQGHSKLVLETVRGPALSSGVKPGDVVTHIQKERVYNTEQYNLKCLDLFKTDPNGQCSLTVNADQEVADHLKTRSLWMRLILRR
jgi:hypothetical protein